MSGLSIANRVGFNIKPNFGSDTRLYGLPCSNVVRYSSIMTPQNVENRPLDISLFYCLNLCLSTDKNLKND